MGTCRRDLESSYCPDGIFTCFVCVLAGWRCPGLGWHGDLLIVHHHWQHSLLCACSRSKVPIAHGRLMFCSLFTGRGCLCLFRHCHNDVLLDHWQHSFWICAFSCSKLPIAPMGFSHVLRFVLAGRRCLHPWWHGDLVILHHHWQHSYICACSRSKFPIDGKLTFCSLFAGRRCLCRLSRSWHSNHIIVHHQ